MLPGRILTMVGCAALLLTGCTSVFFYPDKVLRLQPNDIGLAYEDVLFASTDGTQLHGWFLPAAGTPQATVLFLHGNAENISTHIGSVHWLPAKGYNVFLLDYRGYGRSAGRPTVKRVIEDIESALDLLAQDPRLGTGRIVVFGQSLGGALAIPAVADSRHREQIAALIVDSAFSSYRAIAREKLALFWLSALVRWPLSLVVSDDHSPLDKIEQIPPIPVLIIHGTADSIVAAAHAEALYKRAGEPKTLWLVEKTEHIQSLSSPEERAKLLTFLAKTLSSAAGSGGDRSEPPDLPDRG